tara:strand:+ start:2582 stop:3262 length:681 start_codon:yes stop_codon:yes gene_type:complete
MRLFIFILAIISLVMSGCAASSSDVPASPSQEAVEYFLSDERHDKLQELLDEVGGPVIARALVGDEAVDISDANKLDPAPAPENGLGSLHLRLNDEPGVGLQAQIIVEFVDGEIDSETGPIAMFVTTSRYIIEVRGALSSRVAGIKNSPASYVWSVTDDELDEFWQQIGIVDSNQQDLPWDQPLDPTRYDYRIVKAEDGALHDLNTVEEIKKEDDKLITLVRGLVS